MRLFVALELPSAARSALARWGARSAAGDSALRAVAAPALHVTLHFLGERPEDEVDDLRAVVAGAPDAPVALASAGTLWLAPRRPHVLTCGLASSGTALEALHAVLGLGLAGATHDDWEPDTRPLRPHVTVARVRRGARPHQDGVPAPPALRFNAAAVTLQKSVLSPSGARYETLRRRPLRTGG